MVTREFITFFDSSVLVAGSASSHEQFDWADEQLATPTRKVISTHSLAETYSTLTAHPQMRFAPTLVTEMLRALTQEYQLIVLEPADHLAAIQRCADLNLQGGAIDDTLIAQAALKAGAGALVTLNAKHFSRLGEDIAALVRAPA